MRLALLADPQRDATVNGGSPVENDAQAGPAVPSPAEIAVHFPELEVECLIGQGGMGAVYKARQVSLDRYVALKIIHPRVAQEPGFAERFAREARALARLNHPHILMVHDFGRRDDVCYLIMEYVGGVNLRQLMRDGHLTPAQSLAIVRSLCDALQYAHEEGVVHRDIKPENILVDPKGRIRIADFGLAKLASTTAADGSLTGTRQVMGTPRYMAPEQLEGSRHVDHRADIYSLGVVIYEMLTGELPVGRFEPPSHRVDVDERLDPVVLRALEHDPQRRYQHAVDVKTDLDSIHTGGRAELPPVLARPGIHPPPASAPATVGFPDSGRAVTTVAILMILLGVIQFIVSAAIVIAPVMVSLRPKELTVTIVPVIAFVLVGLAGGMTGFGGLVGGICLLLRRAAPLVWLGAICLLLPTSPMWLVGLPVGIGCLYLLSRPRRPASISAENKKAERPTTRLSGVLPRPRRLITILGLIGLAIALVLILPWARTVTSGKLADAARRGDVGGVQFWARFGANLEKHGLDDMTPLMWAAWEGHTPVVRELIDRGAVVDATTSIGETALMKAAYQGHLSVAQILVEHDADPSRRDVDGQCALLRAAGNGHTPLVELLLSHSTTVDVATQEGLTPLMLAAANGFPLSVERLLAHGANVHARDQSGETVLMKSCVQVNATLVARLLSAGAEVNAQDHDGETALLTACVQGQLPIIQLLLSHKAEPRLASKLGLTPLMAAAANGHDAVVEMLLPVSDVDATGTVGQTALSLAVANGHQRVSDLLVGAGARESGLYQLWKGFRLARGGSWKEAIPWLEKAQQSARDSTQPWQFALNGWNYEVPQPSRTIPALIVDCLLHANEADAARDAVDRARREKNASDQPFVLLRRRQSSPGRSEVHEYSLQHPSSAIPNQPWPVVETVRTVESGANFRRSNEGTVGQERKDLFP